MVITSMNSEDMDNMKNRLLLILLVCFALISCKTTSNVILKDYINNDEFMDEDEESISGFLRETITLKTPYGKMKTGPIGFDTGYQFDFLIYKNNIPKKIWLIEKAKINIDKMNFYIPTFSENQFSYVDFYDNYSIKTCRNSETIMYLDLLIPKFSVLNFSKDGKLDCIVIYGETSFKGKILEDGTIIKIKNNNIEVTGITKN